MTEYPWIKRHKRYLSFRYLFPGVTAAWISFLRMLLRMRWFFTHSFDEFVDDLREALLWPGYAIAWLWRWTVTIVADFLNDLATGILLMLRWLGKIPVWTGAALAGVTGIVLTILLFLLPALQTRPVPASLRAEPPMQTFVSTSPEVEEAATPEANSEDFDPFARPPEPPVDDRIFLPREQELSFNEQQPDLFASVTRLSLPLGWQTTRQVDEVSIASVSPSREGWSGFGSSTLMDGWEEWRHRGGQPGFDFSPYVSRVNVEATRSTTEWITPESTVDPLGQVINSRHPSVDVEKRAPSTSPAGRPYQYTLIVSNCGEETLSSVRIREQVSAIERVTNVRPSANVVGDALVWDVTDLHPGERRRLHVEVHPDEPLLLAQNTEVQVTTGVAAVSEARHPRPEPELVKPTPEPPTEPAPDSHRMILPDFGDDPVEPEPQETDQAGDESEQESDLWRWDPYEENSLPQPPPYVNESPEEPDAAPVANSEAKAPTNSLTLDMETPADASTGGHVPTIFALGNHGQEELTNVVLTVELTDELQHRHGRILELRVDRLAAGETYRTRLTTQAVETGTARISSRVSANDSRQRSAHRDVRITPNVAPANDVVIRVPSRCVPPPCRFQTWF